MSGRRALDGYRVHEVPQVEARRRAMQVLRDLAAQVAAHVPVSYCGRFESIEAFERDFSPAAVARRIDADADRAMGQSEAAPGARS